MKNWTIRDIAVWQENTFGPSVRSQTMKAKCEAREYIKAKKHQKRWERVDWFIAQCWLAYFKKEPNAIMSLEMMQLLPDWEEIQQDINVKMEINLKRTWANVRGEWRHVGED